MSVHNKRFRNRYAEFSAKSKEEQLEQILSCASNCIDATPVYFARWVEIYLDATPEDQERRQIELHKRWNEERAK